MFLERMPEAAPMHAFGGAPASGRASMRMLVLLMALSAHSQDPFLQPSAAAPVVAACCCLDQGVDTVEGSFCAGLQGGFGVLCIELPLGGPGSSL